MLKAAKAEKRIRPVKEVVQNRLELEKAHKEFKGPEGKQRGAWSDALTVYCELDVWML